MVSFTSIARMRESIFLADSAKARFIRVYEFVMVIVSLYLVVSLVIFTFYLRKDNDFTVYRLAAESLAGGGSLYEPSVPVLYEGQGILHWSYMYPPLLGCILAALVRCGEQVLITAWLFLTIAGIFSTAILARRMRLVSTLGIGWVAMCLSLWPPAVDGLEAGQVDAIVLGFLMLFFYGATNDRSVLAGWCLAIAIHLKATPIILIIALFSPALSKVRRPFVTAFAVITLLITTFYGITMWCDFVKSALSTAVGGEAWQSAANMAIVRSLVISAPILDRTSAHLLHRLITGALAIYIFLGCRRASKECVEARIGALIALMVFASPIVWYHHLVWLLLPLLAAWRSCIGFGDRAVVSLCVISLTSSRFVDLYLIQRCGVGPHGALPGPIMVAIPCLILCLRLARSRRCRSLEQRISANIPIGKCVPATA